MAAASAAVFAVAVAVALAAVVAVTVLVAVTVASRGRLGGLGPRAKWHGALGAQNQLPMKGHAACRVKQNK